MNGAGRVAPQVGAWLFRNRGWLPAPFLIAIAFSPVHYPGWGALVVALGESLRLWAVGFIGLPSRTRGDGAHRVVEAGPYAMVRNPLYLGNLLIFLGFGVAAWPWALVVMPLLLVHYGFIVSWEEANILTKMGSPYADYCSRVPRWVPKWRRGDEARWNGREALRSERTTLLVLVVVFSVMAMRVLLYS